MTNEIGRKITSLTLMTIMVAGGLTFAVPGMMPAAQAANANLFVSAENSQFDNYMSGPQVIEVVVIDSDINDTNEGEGEPDVTVNGKKLRMVQATDGNWYGYFADRNQAQIADSTATTAGEGLDFGKFCNNSVDLGEIDDAADSVTVNETVGVAIPRPDSVTGGTVTGSSTGGSITSSCTPDDGGTSGRDKTMNVVRENKSLNLQQPSSDAEDGGQIGLDINFWPFIQLYNLNPTGNVVIQYNKGGGAQTTTLTFDTVDQFAGLELDRSKYPRKSQVHVTVTDLWLNIDPTDEDSWTFATKATTSQPIGTFYQVFDENGSSVGDTSTNIRTGTGSLTDKLSALMCEDNCVLKSEPDTQSSGTNVFTLQDNDDTILENVDSTDANSTADPDNPFEWRTGNDRLLRNIPITIVEQGPNSGVFGTYDESDVSVIKITGDAKRGTSATIDYNETAQTILVGFEFATIDIQPTDDEWSSGEEIPVVLVDADANKNSRADEDLDIFNPDNTIIPALKTGSPFTLEETDKFTFITEVDLGDTTQDSLEQLVVSTGTQITDATDKVDAFSKRAIITPGSTDIDLDAETDTRRGPAFVIDYESRTLGDLKKVVRLPERVATDANFNGGANDVPSTEFNGFSYFNWDLRTFNENQHTTGHDVISKVDIFLIIDEDGSPTNNNDDISADLTTADAQEFCLIRIADDQAPQGRVVLPTSFYQAIYDDDDVTSLDPPTAGTKCADAGGADRVYPDSTPIGILFTLDGGDTDISLYLKQEIQAVTADFTTFGFVDDGVQKNERIADQIIRLELEETGDNTSTFEGSLEYFMVNQLNIVSQDLYDGLSVVADDPSFIVIEDLDDEESPRVNYNDLGADGVVTPVSDQEAAPAHSGVVSFDANTYKIADTVTITLEDADLNVDSDLIDIFTGVDTDTDDAAFGTIGKVDNLDDEVFSFGALGRLLDVTFNDKLWFVDPANACVTDGTDGLTAKGVDDISLVDSGFTLVETGPETGVFIGSFQVPKLFCNPTDLSVDDDGDGITVEGNDSDDNGYSWAAKPIGTTGLDIEVNYVDFRDASGEIIEVGDSAAVSANTGSVSLDRTVYPVPFGVPSNFDVTGQKAPDGDSIFAIHASGFNNQNIDTKGTFLPKGDLTVHVRVNDPDFDISASGEDSIAENTSKSTGPVKVSIIRGAETVVLGYAGGPTEKAGVIAVNDAGALKNGEFRTDGTAGGTAGEIDNTDPIVRQFGPMLEVAPDAGIFEADITIRYTDGPDSTQCPTTKSSGFTSIDGDAGTTVTDRFAEAAASGENYCILQGDILQVEYTDPEDASGDTNTVTDSATFDLRNGVLQSDKSVYIIGSDMILTLIEPDLDLDNDQAETYDLDLIEWDSDAATVTMGDRDGEAAAFDPEPSNFRETGESTGIFQIVIEIPEELDDDRLERGEEIVLEYTDWGPSGADYVGQEDEDINLTIYTSNFGATVELDQKVYSWTDKVYITIVAPDHNFDSDSVDEIGETDRDPIKIATRGADLDKYKLVETGTDTGIFTGEVILTGFKTHDADGDGTTADATGTESGDNGGPTDGLLPTKDDDGITVSFEFSEDETVVGSALIRWNIGEVQWLEASYPASGTGVVRVIDPDMNLDPEAVDNFDVDVWSDSDAGGIDLTVTETNEATGIFEGTVFFTVSDESSGHRLRVAEGDTVTAEYEDHTLPTPYTTADELDITATSLIGTVVPPLERAPAANLRTVDAFGNSLDTVSVDQQVQITADLANGQDREQAFAYLVQIQDASGVTVSLAWITGSLSPGQSFSPALSWIPAESGSYTATAFVWESVDNPTALSPPVTTTINVQ